MPPAAEASPLPEEKSREYNRIKLRLSLADMVLSLLLITLLAFSGISPFLAETIRRHYDGSGSLQFLLFLAVAGSAMGLLGLPMDFYGSYILEHRFGLSNQSLPQWLTERLKSLSVGLVLGIPVALVFYQFLLIAGADWWIYFSLFLFFFSVILARVAPVLIYPLFYKFTPLDDGGLREKITALLKGFDLEIKGIYSFNMSRDTKKANAGFTGIGRSKRIVLSDTLLEKFTPEEIAVVFAHELGHYQKRHIPKNMILSAFVIFGAFYLCGVLYDITRAAYGYTSLHEIAALPQLFFHLTLFGLIVMPLTNGLSRRFEREADRFALELTGDRAAFVSAMEKLADVNLADREPHPLTEFFLYSHPSLKKRIDYARSFEPGDKTR